MKRVLLMLASLGLGLLISVLGFLVTGNELWFLALPLLLSMGWLFVSNPARVLPPDPNAPARGRKRRRKWTRISP
jgi:hypothetical protein